MVDGADDAVGHIGSFQIGNILIREFYCQCSGGVIEILCLRRADDGRGHAFCPVPCQCDLLHSDAVFFGKLRDAGDDLHVLFLGSVVFSHGDAVGAASEGICGPCGARQVAGSQWAVGH